MVIENAHVRAETERLRHEFDEGMVEGYDAGVNAIPDWWFRVPVGNLTARQRGYFCGRQARLIELAEQRGES